MANTNDAKREELQWEYLSIGLSALALFFAIKRYRAKRKQLGE